MKQARRGTAVGVTLIEMMVVVAIIGAMAAISFPAVASGLDSIRLRAASDSVASFLNQAMNRVERRQEVVEVIADPKSNRLLLYSSDPGFVRTLEMPKSVSIAGEDASHTFLLPGGTFPQFAVNLVNSRGARKRVSIEPITGTPRIADLDRAIP